MQKNYSIFAPEGLIVKGTEKLSRHRKENAKAAKAQRELISHPFEFKTDSKSFFTGTGEHVHQIVIYYR